jgi:hypothetical protein
MSERDEQGREAEAEREVDGREGELAPTPLPRSPSLVRRTVTALAMGSALFLGACGDDTPPPSDKQPPQAVDFPIGLDPQATDGPQPPDFHPVDFPVGLDPQATDGPQPPDMARDGSGEGAPADGGSE